MSFEKKVFRRAYSQLDEHVAEIEEAFTRRANKAKKINPEGIEELLNDIGVIMAFDCEAAQKYFSPSNNKNSQGYNLGALTFEQFMELFRTWLKKEAEREEEEKHQFLEKGKTIIEQMFKQDTGINLTKSHVAEGSQTKKKGVKFVSEEEETDEQTREQLRRRANKPVGSLTHQNTRSKMALPDAPNYQHNRKLLDELMKLHEDEYKQIYRDRLLNEDQEKVPIQDCFVVLQECFYMDKVDLKESADAEEDFFQTVGSYKKLYDIAERYFLFEKNVDVNEFDIEETALSFNELFVLLDYWIRTDESIILVDKRTKLDKSVKGTILRTIENYEKMMKESQSDVEKKVLETTIETLKKKLNELETGIVEVETERTSVQSEAQNKKKEIKRKRALREIFFFYCTQQINAGSAHTFDKLERLTNTINLGTFRVLLKNFNLKMDHHKLCELYRKSAGVDDNLDYDEFEDLLTKVALRVEITAEPKPHEPQPEIMKEYKPTSYKQDKTYKIFKENEAKRREEAQKGEMADKAKAVYSDQIKRDAEKIEEIWEHMGLFDGRYKKKINPVRVPFSSHDKQNFRIPPGSLLYKYRAKQIEGKSVEEIQEEVHRRNELRQLVKDLKSVEKSFVSQQKNSSPIRKPPSREQKGYSNRSHAKARSRDIPKVNKLTLKKIEQILYGDIRKVDETFNPHDLIDDNDEEDNEYLGEYNLGQEKKRLRAQDEAERRKIDEYGRLKKVANGIAVNGKYGMKSLSPGRHEFGIEIDPVSANPYIGYQYNQYSGNNLSSSINMGNMGLPRAQPNSVKNFKGPSYLDYDLNSQLNSIKQKNKPMTYIPSVANFVSPRGSYVNGLSHVQHNGYHARSPPGEYSNMMNRANQIEQDMMRREQKLMGNVMNIQNNQMQKAMRIAGKM